MESRIGLIDYGMGNLFSVKKAFERLKRPLQIVNSPKDLDNCDALILPGVGSFDPALEQLKETKLIPHLRTWNKEKKPLLGICLGLQLLFESSDEGEMPGLSLIQGHVRKLPSDQEERIPHMGWSLLKPLFPCPILSAKDSESWVYFVHSYSAIPTKQKNIAASTDFGQFKVSSIIWEERLGACQFHPEKSGKAGEKMLKNWLKWLKNGAKFN